MPMPPGRSRVSSYEHAVANSLGIDSYSRSTFARLSTVVTGPEGGFGYGAAVSQNVADIDPRAVGEEAAMRARDSRNPAGLEPGDYECVLMPYAAADIVSGIRWMGFDALSYQEGRSFLCGKMGTKIVDERINIWDDGLDPRTLVTPFDSEGVPKRRVDLIKDGVATGMPYDSYTAHRVGRKSTGHASGSNLIMAPGSATVDEMIASVNRGLLVTRFHYTNTAHLMTASVTGMTRDGTFLIENGRISHPVRNLRFTQSYTEALSNLDMIGRDLKLVGSTLVPAIKVSKFHFSSATEF
jgi:PmbA protein